MLSTFKRSSAHHASDQTLAYPYVSDCTKDVSWANMLVINARLCTGLHLYDTLDQRKTLGYGESLLFIVEEDPKLSTYMKSKIVPEIFW